MADRVKMNRLGVLLGDFKYSQRFMDFNRRSVVKVDVDLYREEKDGALELRGLYNQMYSTKEYGEEGDIHLTITSSTTVS